VTRPAARIALALVALVALAWVGNEIRIMRLEDDADAVLQAARQGQASKQQVDAAFDQLEDARKLNPDRRPLVTQGELAYARGDDLAASLIARSVTLEEPDNLQAWFLIWAADPQDKFKREALRNLRRLNSWTDVSLGYRDCLTCPRRKSPAR
jgi:hypothetical protein